jgi:hypothetical protein
MGLSPCSTGGRLLAERRLSMATVPTSSRPWFIRPAPGVVRAHVDHLQDPLGHFDLPAMERDLRRDVALATEGQSAVTLVKHADLRVVLIVLRRGARRVEARTGARISLQALRGHLELYLQDGTIDLPAGHLATLDGGMEFGIQALTESAVLLTLSWPPASERAAACAA